MKKVGLVSFMHESNSFNPVLTTREMFEQNCLQFGEAILPEWMDAHHEIGGMLEMAPKLGLEIVPLVTAWAMPSGPLTKQTYEEILEDILNRISSEPLDGLLLSLHGAMVAERVRDADGLSAERIRQTVGPALPIVMTLDLHANVSDRMISNVTATTIYRTYPHLDQRERGREAARILSDILDERTRPVQALEKPPMLISILAQKTDEEPLAHLYRQLEQLLQQPGTISASIALGFPYADVEEMGPSFLLVADADERFAQRGARTLAKTAWALRQNCSITGISVEEAIHEATQTGEMPITLLDLGDNVGGGSPGDSTIIFAAIERARVDNALVILYDPQAVQACIRAGVGETVRLRVGGKTDQLHGSPVALEGRVRLLHDGFFVERQARHGGRFLNNQGLTAVVETAEQHTVILTSLRMAPFSLEQILSLGIEPEWKRILIAKGAIAPRAAYEPVSVRLIEVDSPGITSANPAHFTYHRRRKPMFPFERDAEYDPD